LVNQSGKPKVEIIFHTKKGNGLILHIKRIILLRKLINHVKKAFIKTSLNLIIEAQLGSILRIKLTNSQKKQSLQTKKASNL